MENKEKKPQNPPAFPLIDEIGNFIETGMTLRDYFANSAMQSIIIRLGGTPLLSNNDQDTFELVAKESYKYADAMLKEREDETSK